MPIGQHPNAQLATCPQCGGTGAVQTQSGTAAGCPWCKGAGQLVRSNTSGRFLRALFWYPLIDNVLTASQTLPGALQIDPRADFEWVWAVSTQTGTWTSRLIDKSGRTFDNASVNNANRFGTIQLPFTLPVPVVLPMKTNITWSITDTSGGGNTIQAELVGYELYPQLDDAGQPMYPNT